MKKGRILWFVQLDFTDTSREEEFNQWYSKVHMPTAAKGPGVVRATRYKAIRQSPLQRKYLTVYEIDSQKSIDALMLSPEVKNAMNDTVNKGFRPLINIAPHAFWKRIEA